MRLANTALVICLIGASSSAVAAETKNDGHELLEQCVLAEAFTRGERRDLDASKFYSIGFCLGMMNGITSTALFHQYAIRKTGLGCLPEGGITNGEAVRIVVKFLQENPSMLHMKGSLLAMTALMKAYPCK